jgi:hypothetical protein
MWRNKMSDKSKLSKQEASPVPDRGKNVSNRRRKRGELQGPQTIYPREEAFSSKITAERYCASLPIKADQTAGFLAECRLKYKQNELCTVAEWSKRYETFKKRLIK